MADTNPWYPRWITTPEGVNRTVRDHHEHGRIMGKEFDEQGREKVVEPEPEVLIGVPLSLARSGDIPDPFEFRTEQSPTLEFLATPEPSDPPSPKRIRPILKPPKE